MENGILTSSAAESIVETGEATYAYCDPHQPQSCLQAVQDLERYLRVKGPYDGVMAFSLGTSIALTILIDHARQTGMQDPPFKVAILFSNPGKPYDMEFLRLGRIEPWDPQPMISIPTAHVWGSADPLNEKASLAPGYCKEENKSIFVHKGGHQIPTAAGEVVMMANVIHRAIGQA